jgi:DNA-directed RNA polymerase specialized sigma24 family protein
MIDLHSSQPQPEHLTVSELLLEAHKEIQAHPHTQPTAHATAYAFELFHRAIGQCDEQAWSGLYELYYALVSSWMLRRAPALVAEELAALVNEVFAKFFRSIGPEKLKNFPSVGSLLAYLKCCTSSVWADYCRSQRTRQREDPLESLPQESLMLDDFAASVIDHLTAQEAWAVIAGAVPAQEERLILVLVCSQGWSPAKLQHRYPCLFPSVEDVYRRRRNVCERLRRNQELLHLLERPSPYQPREVQHAG